jgi:hypothetical protein
MVLPDFWLGALLAVYRSYVTRTKLIQIQDFGCFFMAMRLGPSIPYHTVFPVALAGYGVGALLGMLFRIEPLCN